MKRIIALLQCITFLCIGGILCINDAYANEEASYKTVYINVAQNKPVTVSESFIQEMASYPLFSPEKMTDGKITSCALGTFPKDSYIQVDLQRKYLLKEITLTDRYDADHAPIRTNLEILASNDENFSSFDVIDSVGENADAKFSYKGKWEIKLDGKKPYRYIRVKMNHSAYGGFGELQVFADQNVTQLDIKEAYASRETVSENYTYSALFAIDGKNENAGHAWVADGNDIYHYIRFTIPKNKHIGMIEIEDRYKNGNNTTRQADVFYGSDSYIDHNTAITLNSFSSYEEYTYLGTTGHYGDYPAPEIYPYPTYPEGIYRVNFNDEKAFGYFTMKKDYPLSATIGEIRFFEVNPQILSFDTDIKTKTATISFSDEMDFSSVSDNTFTLTDGEDILYVTGKSTDSYTYVLDLSSLEKEKTYTLTISKDLRNLKNAGLCENYIKKGISINDYSCSGIDISDKKNPGSPVDLYSCEELMLSSDITNNTKEDKDFLLIYTQYDKENSLIKTDVSPKTIKALSHDTISLDHKLSISPGDSVRAFLWTDDLRPIDDSGYLSAPYKNIYVSQSGDDKNPGTAEFPVATIKRAQQLVRKINSSMDEDINVFISDGVFIQNEPLTFESADSGKNNFNINYIGGKNTVISGGQKVTDFKKVNESGLYCADLDAESVRELYVNGKKAVRAQSENKIKPISVYEENGIKEGFIIEKDAFSAYENPSDIQFHYHRSWRSLVLNVSSIKETDNGYIVKMKQPEFSYASAPLGEGFSFWVDETNGFYIENAFELLDNENEFYYDKSENKLYYKTLNTDMSNAEVYIPRLEQLIVIKGDNLKNKVKNITFDNLNFAHCAFKMPDNGYLGDQAQRFESLDIQKTSYPLDTNIVGAGIRISAADNIDFKDSTFFSMGAVALGLYDGSENCDITGNVFYDINDSAITVGLPSDAYMQTPIRTDNEIAIYKPTTATSEEKHYLSCYANDGDAATGWTMSMGDSNTYLDKYWQVDLGKEYTISNITIKARKGYNQENTRRNFEILGSNDEKFSEGSYNVLASQGGEAFSIENGYSADVSDAKKYRYVRVRKTVNEYFFLADIEIYTSDEAFIPAKEVCKNNNIKNNYITNIGAYNSGAPGIQTYYTEGLTISHNTIKNVPYSGIALGWGWTQTPDSTTSKNNIISDNLIDTFNSVNFDGGGIYTLGQQPGSIISGNYIKNQINGHAGYYPDSGSAEYTFTGNVIEDCDIAFFLYGPQKNLTVYSNYANTNNTVYNNKGTDCTVEAQKFFIPGKESEEILAIKNNAGLEEKYKNLLSVPYEKKTVTTDTDYNYGNAIDENKWNIGAMQDPKFLEIYLQYLIEYAEDLYDTGTILDKMLNEKYRTFGNKLTTAKNAYNTAKKQITYATYDSETGIYAEGEGMTMDRKAVIIARLNLKAAIAEFLSN